MSKDGSWRPGKKGVDEMASANRRMDIKAVSTRSVVNSAGERLGHIIKLIVDVQDGRIEFATLALAGQSTDSGCKLNIPWSQFYLSMDGQRLQLDISPAVLKTVAARQTRS